MRLQMRFEVTEGIGDVRAAYPRLNRNENPVLQEIDRLRMQRWDANEARGYYLRHRLHAFFIWNPRTHHELVEKHQGKKKPFFSLSAEKCIERERREHEDLLAEFSSLLAGVEQTLVATGMEVRRMADDEMFLEAKRALNPVFDDRSPLRRGEYSLIYQSARSQITNTSIEDEQENHLRVGGLLYSLVSMKDLPDGTFPGILRELLIRLSDYRQCRGDNTRPDEGSGALQRAAPPDASRSAGFSWRVQDQCRSAGRPNPIAGSHSGGSFVFAEGLQLLVGDRSSDVKACRQPNGPRRGATHAQRPASARGPCSGADEWGSSDSGIPCAAPPVHRQSSGYGAGEQAGP